MRIETNKRRRRRMTLAATDAMCNHSGRPICVSRAWRSGRPWDSGLRAALADGGREEHVEDATAEIVWQRLATLLSPETLDVVVQFVVLGWSVEEIGRQVGRHKSTISRRVQQALAAARNDADTQRTGPWPGRTVARWFEMSMRTKIGVGCRHGSEPVWERCTLCDRRGCRTRAGTPRIPRGRVADRRSASRGFAGGRRNASPKS